MSTPRPAREGQSGYTVPMITRPLSPREILRLGLEQISVLVDRILHRPLDPRPGSPRNADTGARPNHPGIPLDAPSQKISRRY